MNIEMCLPWPPSVNTYYRHFAGRVLLSEKGRKYKIAVRNQAIQFGWHTLHIAEPCRLRVVLETPAVLSLDADNRLKAIQDSLEYAGVLADDKWIMFVSAGKTKNSTKRCIVLLEWGDMPSGWKPGGASGYE